MEAKVWPLLWEAGLTAHSAWGLMGCTVPHPRLL